MPKIRASNRDDGVQAAVLALRILEYLAAHPEPCGVTALSVALNTTKNRIHRHLRTLVGQGYVVQVAESDKYRVGVRLITLGHSVSEQYDLATVAREAMSELRDELGHFVCLAQIETEGTRVVATISGRSMIEIGVKHGSLLSFHSSAAGKVALAFGPEAIRERVFRSRLDPHTPKTITTPSALRKEVAKVQKQRWAVAPNEVVLGLNTLAAPVYDASGGLAAVLSIVDSIQFIPSIPSSEQVRETLTAARRVSAALGYRANTGGKLGVRSSIQ